MIPDTTLTPSDRPRRPHVTVSCRPQLPVPMIIHTGIYIAIILPGPDPRVAIGPFSEQIHSEIVEHKLPEFFGKCRDR